MEGFSRVDAYGLAGDDYASVYGTLGNDHFYTFDTYEVLQGGGVKQKTSGFERVDAFGRAGNDFTHLFDTVGNDHFYSFATYAVMQSDHLRAVAKGFERIEANANKGGQDTTHFMNLKSVDLLFGEGNLASVVGPERNVTSLNFETVEVKAAVGEVPTTEITDILYELSGAEDWI
jgi:hypothetical protein